MVTVYFDIDSYKKLNYSNFETVEELVQVETKNFQSARILKQLGFQTSANSASRRQTTFGKRRERKFMKLPLVQLAILQPDDIPVPAYPAICARILRLKHFEKKSDY